MKKTILAIASLGLFLSAGICFAQELTSWERDVYYDLMQEASTSGEYRGKSNHDRFENKIAKKHGISLKELDDIVHKNCSIEFTQREEVIFREVKDERLDRRVLQRTADKYGVSPLEVYEIYYRAWYILLWSW